MNFQTNNTLRPNLSRQNDNSLKLQEPASGTPAPQSPDAAGRSNNTLHVATPRPSLKDAFEAKGGREHHARQFLQMNKPSQGPNKNIGGYNAYSQLGGFGANAKSKNTRPATAAASAQPASKDTDVENNWNLIKGDLSGNWRGHVSKQAALHTHDTLQGANDKEFNALLNKMLTQDGGKHLKTYLNKLMEADPVGGKLQAFVRKLTQSATPETLQKLAKQVGPKHWMQLSKAFVGLGPKQKQLFLTKLGHNKNQGPLMVSPKNQGEPKTFNPRFLANGKQRFAMKSLKTALQTSWDQSTASARKAIDFINTLSTLPSLYLKGSGAGSNALGYLWSKMGPSPLEDGYKNLANHLQNKILKSQHTTEAQRRALTWLLN